MSAPAFVPTITQRVRTFLADRGAKLRPWSGLQETYDELYVLLRQRRRDPEFWQPLKSLLQEVVASAADSQRRDPGTTAHAELLASWKVDELVDDLRDALPDKASSARTDFTRSLPTAVLGGFLLLGLAAAGCGGDSEPTNAGGTGGTLGAGGRVTMVTGTGGAVGTGGKSGMGGASAATLPGTGGSGLGGRASGGAGGTAVGGAGGNTGSNPLDGGTEVGSDTALDTADAAGIDGGAVDVATAETMGIDAAGPACTQTMASELNHAIGESTLETSQKSQLCECFAALGAGWTTGLTQLFATATPQEISRMLSGLVSCCSPKGIRNTEYGINEWPTSKDLDMLESGQGYWLCHTPIYKGVSFPD